MGHGHHTSMSSDPWVIGLIIVALITVVTGIIWFARRRMVASDGLTPLERKGLDFQEREILSMLRQCGGPMRQNEIVDALSGDLEDMAGVMKDMEAKGLIHREWKSDMGTYIVSTRPEYVENKNGQ